MVKSQEVGATNLGSSGVLRCGTLPQYSGKAGATKGDKVIMLGVNPYITFNGNCEEAINFYAECLGGTIQGFHRVSDSPMASPDMDPNKIFHTTLIIGRLDDHGIGFLWPGIAYRR